MLEVVTFIKKNPDWKTILTTVPYCLTISENEDYILLKYNQIKSDFSLTIVRECRGLILRKTDFKPVRYAFKKFFNYGEIYADKVDWNTGIVSEKMDGSLMSLWYDNDEWHCSTNGTINASKAPLSTTILYKNFKELFDVAASNSGLDYSKLNKTHCYTFELCSQFNKIVIAYSKPQLFHISTRQMYGDYKEIEEDIGVIKPKIYNLNNQEECLQLINKMDNTHEGVVVKDCNENRIKIKTPLYFEAHRLVNNGSITTKTVTELIKSNEQSEFLSYFPEYKSYFKQVENQLNRIDGIIEKVKQDVLEWQLDYPAAPRSWFAQDFSNKKYKFLYFAVYDNKLDEVMNKMTTEKLIKTFNIE